MPLAGVSSAAPGWFLRGGSFPANRLSPASAPTGLSPQPAAASRSYQAGKRLKSDGGAAAQSRSRVKADTAQTARAKRRLSGREAIGTSGRQRRGYLHSGHAWRLEGPPQDAAHRQDRVWPEAGRAISALNTAIAAQGCRTWRPCLSARRLAGRAGTGGTSVALWRSVPRPCASGRQIPDGRPRRPR